MDFVLHIFLPAVRLRPDRHPHAVHPALQPESLAHEGGQRFFFNANAGDKIFSHNHQHAKDFAHARAAQPHPTLH